MRAFVPLVALVLGSGAQACRESEAQTPPTGSAAQQAVQSTPARDSSGRFVAHVEHITPGGGPMPKGLVLRNPYEGNASAVGNGAKLFVAYNCADCHGADGSGAMGPSLADGRWHFGGTAPEVFESIYQGRPDGMPAWGAVLSPDQIWTLVTYVRSLERGKNVTTENVTGATVERTGH
jgi:cytochrome c oxidase cbb3-type subunit 3